MSGWRADADTAIAMAASLDATSRVQAIMYKYVLAIPTGALPADALALRETATALRIAEQAGDDLTLALARLTRGLVLVHHSARRRPEGFDLLIRAREVAVGRGFPINAVALVDPELAKEKARTGDLGGAIEMAKTAVAKMIDSGALLSQGVATTVLVEALLARGAADDLREAATAIESLAVVPTDPGFVLHELPLLRLRGLVAQAHGDVHAFHEFMRRHRATAETAGFEALA
jgi:hypothetical protein